LSLDGLIDEYNAALKTGIDRDLALFLSQRLGVEPNDNKATGVAPLREFWPALPAPDEPGAWPVVVSLDPSSGTDDPFAMCCMWREGNDVAFRVMQFLTAHGYSRAGDALRGVYDQAKACGELVVCDTASEMVDLVVAEVATYADGGEVIIGGDAYGLTGLTERLSDVLWNEFATVSQGWKLLKSMELIDALALDGKLRPMRTPLLTFNIESLVLENGPKGRVFSKRDAGLSGQGQAKIDGLMATLSALDLLYSRPEQTFDAAALIG